MKPLIFLKHISLPNHSQMRRLIQLFDSKLLGGRHERYDLFLLIDPNQTWFHEQWNPNMVQKDQKTMAQKSLHHYL